MPIYEYVCMSCESHFEELVGMSDPDPACPDCGNRRSPSSSARRSQRTASPGSPPSVAAAVAVAVVAAAADLSLLAYGDEVAGCTRCALAQTRTQVVFGSGSPTAELMFVGEAPGFHEDKQGVPFVGAAGKLLAKLLDGIGLTRATTSTSANVLKCRPPGQPRPAARGDRGLRDAPLPPDRADPADGSSRRSATSRRSCSPASRPASRRCTAASSRSCSAATR